MNLTPKQIELFWSKVKKTSGCWEWMGYREAKGYGKIKINGKVYQAHRIAYSLIHGKMPVDEYVSHRCNDPSCVNPEHLFLKEYSGPHLHGEINPNARLTEEEVRSIRAEYTRGETTQKELAEKYGVHHSQISNIVLRKKWVHV